MQFSSIQYSMVAWLWLTIIISATTTTASFVEDPSFQSLSCQELGYPCDALTTCCTGICTARGICRKPKCAKKNQACAVDTDCCGKRICGSTGTCVKKTAIPKDGGGGNESPTNPPAVTSWPDAVGMNGEDAKTLILASNPDLLVEIHDIDGFMTMDYSETRVRIMVDSDNIVVVIPTIG